MSRPTLTLAGVGLVGLLLGVVAWQARRSEVRAPAPRPSARQAIELGTGTRTDALPVESALPRAGAATATPGEVPAALLRPPVATGERLLPPTPPPDPAQHVPPRDNPNGVDGARGPRSFSP